MPDYTQMTIRAAHVPWIEGGETDGSGITDPSRSLAKVEFHVTGLIAPSSGREYEGLLILHIRDDGVITGKLHGHQVVMHGVYTDDQSTVPVEELKGLEEIVQDRFASTEARRGVWQDTRMLALYHEARQASIDAKKYYDIQQEKFRRYNQHLKHYYQLDPDGHVPLHVDGIEYITLADDGSIVDD